jgi:hypothetical protein
MLEQKSGIGAAVTISTQTPKVTMPDDKAKAKAASEQEHPNDKWYRLACHRADIALNGLRLIGNLAGSIRSDGIRDGLRLMQQTNDDKTITFFYQDETGHRCKYAYTSAQVDFIANAISEAANDAIGKLRRNVVAKAKFIMPVVK